MTPEPNKSIGEIKLDGEGMRGEKERGLRIEPSRVHSA